MFWKGRTNERYSAGHIAQRREKYRKKGKPPMPENLVEWADRVIVKTRSGDCSSGRKKKSPQIFITVLTLTMLFLCFALICIYK